MGLVTKTGPRVGVRFLYIEQTDLGNNSGGVVVVASTKGNRRKYEETYKPNDLLGQLTVTTTSGSLTGALWENWVGLVSADMWAEMNKRCAEVNNESSDAEND